METSTYRGGHMHTKLIHGSGKPKTRIIGGLVVILSLTFLLCAGCVGERSENLSECINNSFTTPISRADAVIVALSHPGVAEAIEQYPFYISVDTAKYPDVPEEGFKEYYIVRIERYNTTSREQLESLLVDVTSEGYVYKVRRLPPNPEVTLPIR